MTDQIRPTPAKPSGVTDRAQPGDVLGIERDGETTHLGEDREDEDTRREDAEEELAEEELEGEETP